MYEANVYSVYSFSCFHNEERRENDAFWGRLMSIRVVCEFGFHDLGILFYAPAGPQCW